MSDNRLQEVNELDLLHGVISDNDTVIVEFGAAWCGPCRSFLPHFTKFADKHPEIACVKVDIDVDPSVVSEYKIQSVPQVMLFKDGQYVKHLESRTVVRLEQEI